MMIFICYGYMYIHISLRHSYMHICIYSYIWYAWFWWYRLMIRLGFVILINDDCSDVRIAWKILLHYVIPLSVVLYPPVRHDKTQPTIQSHGELDVSFSKESTDSWWSIGVTSPILLGISIIKDLPPVRQREIGLRSKLRADCLWKTGIRCRRADMCRFEWWRVLKHTNFGSLMQFVNFIVKSCGFNRPHIRLSMVDQILLYDLTTYMLWASEWRSTRMSLKHPHTAAISLLRCPFLMVFYGNLDKGGCRMIYQRYGSITPKKSKNKSLRFLDTILFFK